MKESSELSIELWLEYWNLYDWACWEDYLNRPSLKREYDKSAYALRSYLHDNILVVAIEQIEHNLKKVDSSSKFLYWFRFREEFLLITGEYRFDNKLDLEKKAKLKFDEYTSNQNQSIKQYRSNFKVDFEYFKWFYVALCSLRSDAMIYLNEILFSLPIFNQSEVNNRNLELLEQERKDKIINIYNYGSIDRIINNLEHTVKSVNETTKQNNIQIVELIIENFKRQIEYNGLFKLLYEGREKKLRHENTAQQLFFSVAQIFCLANDLDVSPETNSGLGSVDFKFSKGLTTKINVEIKYSNHSRLKHGLMKQLKEYDLSEQTSNSYFVVIQVDNKEKVIQEIQDLDKELNGEKTKVKIIDGRPKKSASTL